MAMNGTGQPGQRGDTQQMPDSTVSATASKSQPMASAGPGGAPMAEAIVIRPSGNGGFMAESMTKGGVSAPQTFQNYYDLEQWVGQQFGVSPDQEQGEPSDQGDGGGDDESQGGAQTPSGNADQSAAVGSPGPDEQSAGS